MYVYNVHHKLVICQILTLVVLKPSLLIMLLVIMDMSYNKHLVNHVNLQQHVLLVAQPQVISQKEFHLIKLVKLANKEQVHVQMQHTQLHVLLDIIYKEVIVLQ